MQYNVIQCTVMCHDSRRTRVTPARRCGGAGAVARAVSLLSLGSAALWERAAETRPVSAASSGLRRAVRSPPRHPVSVAPSGLRCAVRSPIVSSPQTHAGPAARATIASATDFRPPPSHAGRHDHTITRDARAFASARVVRIRACRPRPRASSEGAIRRRGVITRHHHIRTRHVATPHVCSSWHSVHTTPHPPLAHTPQVRSVLEAWETARTSKMFGNSVGLKVQGGEALPDEVRHITLYCIALHCITLHDVKVQGGEVLPDEVRHVVAAGQRGTRPSFAAREAAVVRGMAAAVVRRAGAAVVRSAGAAVVRLAGATVARRAGSRMAT